MKLIQVLLFLFFTLNLFSQKTTDVIVLKNESVIKGKITKQDSLSLKIESNGNTWVFDKSEIVSTSTEKRQSNDIPLKKFILFYELEINGNENSSAEFNTGVVYKLSNFIISGGGVGLTNIDGDIYIPCYADARFIIPNHPNIPNLNIQTGFLYPLENSSSYNLLSSLFIQLGPTITINRPNNKSVYFSAGWKYSQIEYENLNDWRGNVKTSMQLKRVYFKLGWLLY